MLRAASDERLQEKLREVWRRLVTCLPVGASAKIKTESLMEMRSTLKAVEKDSWRIWNLTSASALEERSGDLVVVSYAFVY